MGVDPEPAPGRGRRRLRRAAVVGAAAVLLPLLGWHYLAGLDDPPAGDGERQFIIFGEHSFRLAFIERTLDTEAWARDRYNFGARNPHVGKYLIGASLYAHGYGREDAGTLDHFRRGADGGWERVPGRLPAGPVTAAARLPVALTGIGACLVVLAIGGLLGWRWGAPLAAGLLATDAHFRFYSRLVLTDVPEAFFASVALLVLLWSVRRWALGPRAVLGDAALVGVAVALAVSTKLRALLALASAVATYLLGAAYARLGWRRGGAAGSARPGWLLAGFLVVAVVVPALFVGMNPLLYDEPIARTGHLLGLGQLGKLIGRQPAETAGSQRHRHAALSTPGEKLYWFWRMSFVNQGVLARGARPSPTSVWHLLGVALTAVGLAGAGREALREHRAGRPPVHACFLVWVIVSVVGVVVWTPFRWFRYYLYLFPIWALLIGRGAELTAAAAGSALRRLGMRGARRRPR